MTYWPHPQLAYSAMTLTVRTAGDPATFTPMIERAVHEMDKDQPVGAVRTMDEQLSRSLTRRRFSVSLLTGFGAVALFVVMKPSGSARRCR